MQANELKQRIEGQGLPVEEIVNYGDMWHVTVPYAKPAAQTPHEFRKLIRRALRGVFHITEYCQYSGALQMKAKIRIPEGVDANTHAN